MIFLWEQRNGEELALMISTSSAVGTYEAAYDLRLTLKLSRMVVVHVVWLACNSANPEPSFALQSQTSYSLPNKLHLLELFSTAFPVPKAKRMCRWEAEWQKGFWVGERNTPITLL